jgi:hypothetical protein
MRITSTGNVGIGTTTPLRQLHISNTSANSEIAFTSGTSGVASILFGDGLTGTDIYKGYIQYQHSGDYMLIATGTTARLRVDADGLKFNADTAAANALNDYEEGTWTPVMDSSSQFTFSGSVSGNYIKVGNKVFVKVFYNVTETGSFSIGQVTHIKGFPYAVSGYVSSNLSIWYNASNRIMLSGGRMNNTNSEHYIDYIYGSPTRDGSGYVFSATYITT